MIPERWQQVASIYEGALERTEEERGVFLDEACAGDLMLRHEIDTLLVQERAASPLDSPVWIPDNLIVQPTSLAAGTCIGVYRIEGILGAGGMGEVYRAHDTKLGRGVALKVLPEIFASDPKRRARFQREAQVLAALNHPHIAAIHGFEDSGSVHALVLELVEGPTLAERLTQGPMPLDEAIVIALQIVDALDAAHDQAIVHRDLKPANIKLRIDGTVKVLDFGLARLVQTEPEAIAVGAPTITSPAMLTAAGAILGTAAYMSPEQAKGRSADARSDVWAFGCVLYEMLTATRPFPGDDVAETLAAVLRAEPEWFKLPTNTPAAIHRLLARCLQKDRQHRLAAIADARPDLEEAKSPVEQHSLRSSRTPWIMAATALLGLVIAVVVAMMFALGRSPDSAPPIDPLRFTIAAPENRSFGGPLLGGTGNAAQIAISPDGRHIAFVAGTGDHYQLWLRPIAALNAAPIPGTEDAMFPFWSPDSRAIAFFAGLHLKKVEIAGGPPIVLCEAPGGRGGSWNRDNVILFNPSPIGGLQRVSSAGGVPIDVMTPPPDTATSYRWPHFLPDGRHFLYTATSGSCCPAPQPAVVSIGSLDPGEAPVSLMEAESSVFYATGHLFFARGQTLMAQSFDATMRQLHGDAFPVAEGVSWEGSRYVSASASETGTLVYGQGALPSIQQMTWFDRAGRTTGALGSPTGYHSLALSPDERHVAVTVPTGNPSNLDVWLFDVASGNSTRLTATPRLDGSPVWSPDSTHIAFESERSGKASLRLLSIDGTVDEPLIESADADTPTSWSRDGRFLAFTRKGPSGSSDIWAVPMSGDRTPFPVAQTTFDETSGMFSPDGRWMAFTSHENGRPMVFVQPFPGPGVRYPISSDSGSHPVWRADGKELFYLSVGAARDGTLIAVPIDLAGRIESGAPHALFRAGAPRFSIGQIYASTKDGQRFLVNARPQIPLATPLTVVVNWMATLRNRPDSVR